nr:leucine-rich repeat extensin-like protein 6 [Ipomoea batatas]
MEVPIIKICLLASLVISVASGDEWAGSKYQIECTMCSACDNPCSTPSPPPPSPPPPSTLNCPPPPSGGGGTNYYSPPPPPSTTNYPPYTPPSGGGNFNENVQLQLRLGSRLKMKSDEE